MIPESAITAWSAVAPWTNNEQIEQDLVIARALIEIYRNSFLSETLAFRGGTAIHKLFFDSPVRYSEDIDLVQIEPSPIKKTIDYLRDALLFLGKPSVKQKANNNTLIYKFDSEISPVFPMRLKIEINCREHFSVLGLLKKRYEVNNQWFTGECSITTYHLEELLATKLRALYQRKKGRDLFDLYKALSELNVDVLKVINCYKAYMKFNGGSIPSKKLFLKNLERKIYDPEFTGDTTSLLKSGDIYDPAVAFDKVANILLNLKEQKT